METLIKERNNNPVLRRRRDWFSRKRKVESMLGMVGEERNTESDSKLEGMGRWYI